MDKLILDILYFHAFVGGISLFSGPIAIFTTKGSSWHRKAGRIYFWAMTLVFITGIMLASFHFNRFLFLIAFLSYYTVFAGLRSLKLKQLHITHSPEWYDWLAGLLNGVVNMVFVGYGLYLLMGDGLKAGAVLSICFGVGGVVLTYTNLKPFVVKPARSNYWYISHMGNMMGGYIATTTAFLSTLVSRYEFMNPYLAFALPALLGIPVLFFWINREERLYDQRRKIKASKILI